MENQNVFVKEVVSLELDFLNGIWSNFFLKKKFEK